MKSRSKRSGLARSLVALSVSLAVVVSSTALSFANSAAGSTPKSNSAAEQNSSAPSELKITSVTATKTPSGVLLQWHTNSTPDNVGFNVYRVKDGRRTKANREIIPGAVFGPPAAMMRGGYSYGWLDRDGTADSVYYIESVNLQGAARLHDAAVPVAKQSAADGLQAPESLSGPENAEAERSYPSVEGSLPNVVTGSLDDQFVIAAQTALKIGIKKDGWYRVTQPQMVAAGFNPTVDIRNLRLFEDSKEVAISTSQSSGPFGASDFIEFYGQRFDTPTTDTRIYYLVAGTTAGKRVIGQNRTNDDDPPPVPPPPVETPTPPVASAAPAAPRPVLADPIFYSRWLNGDVSWILDGGLKPGVAAPQRATAAGSKTQRDQSATENSGRGYAAPLTSYSPAKAEEPANEDSGAAGATTPVVVPHTKSAKDAKATNATGRNTPSNEKASVVRLPGAVDAAPARKPAARAAATNQFRKSKTSRKRKRARTRRPTQRQEHSHAVMSLAAAPANFPFTTERKDRGIYFVSVINGDKENYFGQVLAFAPPPATPPTQTINSFNPDLTAPGPAKLEIALQGANAGFHQITIEFNGVTVGSFAFNGFDPASGGNPVQVFNIPIAQLHDGANTVRFVVPSTGDLSIVDYVRLSYPHLFNADAGSLRFSLRGSQTRKVDGFATRQVRLIDYTDPYNCIVTKPDSEPSASGFAITVPLGAAASKAQRLLYAVSQGQFETAASLTLNQPSTLHTGNLSATVINGADFLIIAHQTLMASMTPLLNLRQSQGKIAAVVNVEDVYDEFSFGTHGPQALRDFLSYANTNWLTKPRYVIFCGDASLDPRNYEGLGNFDFVPTKLLDATYSETASDDWMTDFNDDGVGDIPSGRFPVRTAAEANTIVTKILNYSPALVPQSAMLVADDPGTPPLFDFETSNDNVQALLPAGMPVQRVNVRLQGSQSAHDDVTNGINQGLAIVNYSGHGTLDSWASSVIFRASPDAAALTNGNKLPFVVVMDCLNGYFQAQNVQSLSEAFVKAPAGGAIAVFASSGLTTTPGQRQMELELYRQLYGAQVIPLGDAIKIAKIASTNIDVRRTWILFGDPLMKIR